MSVRVKNNAIVITRGDTLRTNIIITDSEGNPYTPGDDDIITFGVRKNAKSETQLIEKIIPNDTLELYLSPSDTKALDFGNYYYDIQLQMGGEDGDIYTIINMAKLVLKEEVV